MGISALRQGKSVYCVGTSIYAMPERGNAAGRLLEPTTQAGSCNDC